MVKKRNNSALIVNPKNQILIIKRSDNDDSMPGVWELPSGGIEENESIEESVLREVKEEVGIVLDSCGELVDTEKYQFTNKKGVLKEVTEYTFLVKVNDIPEVILSTEHSNYAWANYNELLNFFNDEDDLIYRRINRIFKNNEL